MNHPLTDRQGNEVVIGPMIAQGGEGAVHSIEGHSKFVAKLYHRPPDREKTAKLEAMVGAKTGRLLKLAAWPVEVLSRTQDGVTVGIVMPKIAGYKDIHLLYGPRSRMRSYPMAGWEFLIRTAANLARSFGVVHEHGHVLGDVNDKVALVSDQAIVKLIDCDGFQISKGKQTFSCDVGVLTHQPPELQGVSTFRGLHRSINHDNFGLAVLIFQLLFLARHPFSGTFLGKGEMPLERAIRDYRFVYGQGARKSQMSPPPLSMGLEEVTPEIAQLFEAAFSKHAVKNKRPLSNVWAQALDKMSKSLSRCHTNPSHAFLPGRSCPFCAIEAHSPSALFTLPVLWKTKDGVNRTLCVNIGTLWKAIRSIDGPGPPTNVDGIEEGQGLAGKMRRHSTPGRAGRFLLIGAGLAATGAVTMSVGPMGLLGALIVPIMWPGKSASAENLLATVERWDAAVDRWRITAAGRDFVLLQTELHEAKKALETLDEEHQERMDEVSSKRKELQLIAYLDGHTIADAPIQGISRAATAVLESYGIETANDVTSEALSRVSGVPAASKKALKNWAGDLDSRFQFDPDQRLDPLAVARVENETHKRRAHLVQVLVEGPARLRNVSTQVRTNRLATMRAIERTLDDLRRCSRAA